MYSAAGFALLAWEVTPRLAYAMFFLGLLMIAGTGAYLAGHAAVSCGRHLADTAALIASVGAAVLFLAGMFMGTLISE